MAPPPHSAVSRVPLLLLQSKLLPSRPSDVHGNALALKMAQVVPADTPIHASDAEAGSLLYNTAAYGAIG